MFARIVAFSMCILLLLCVTAFAAEIHAAAAKGDVAKVKALLGKKPALLNEPDKDGATPLHHAVASARKAVVELLVSHKANVNAAKKDGVRPIHIAASVGDKNIAKLLVDAKAQVSVEDKKGRTPVSIAQDRNKTVMVEYLLSLNAQTSDTAKVEPTPPSPGDSPTPAKEDTQTLDSIAEEFVEKLAMGQFSKAADYLDSNMKSLMPANKLAETHKAVIAQLGAYQGIAGSRTTTIEDNDVVYVSCKFQNATVDLQIAFDSERKISGLYYVPGK